MISSKDWWFQKNTLTPWSCWVIRFKFIPLLVPNETHWQSEWQWLKKAFSEEDRLSFDSGYVSSDSYPSLARDAKNFTDLFGSSRCYQTERWERWNSWHLVTDWGNSPMKHNRCQSSADLAHWKLSSSHYHILMVLNSSVASDQLETERSAASWCQCFLKSASLCWKSSGNSEYFFCCTVSIGLVGFAGRMETLGVPDSGQRAVCWTSLD